MKIKNNDKVSVYYEGTLNDGSIFDSKQKGDEPLELVVGSNKLLPMFESSLMGHKEGDEVNIKIPCKNAYGSHQANLVIVCDKKEFPDDITLKTLFTMTIKDRDGVGRTLPCKVVEITDNNVVIDANHPLAGKDINFKINIISVESI
jgi:peptidylprolyl isomerase